MGPPLKTSLKRIGHTYKYYVTAFGESRLRRCAEAPPYSTAAAR